jgi:hypothetical protein
MAGSVVHLNLSEPRSPRRLPPANNVAEEYTKNQMQDAAKKGAATGTAKQRQGAAAQQRAGASAEACKQAYSSCMTAKGFPGQ